MWVCVHVCTVVYFILRLFSAGVLLVWALRWVLLTYHRLVYIYRHLLTMTHITLKSNNLDNPYPVPSTINYTQYAAVCTTLTLPITCTKLYNSRLYFDYCAQTKWSLSDRTYSSTVWNRRAFITPRHVHNPLKICCQPRGTPVHQGHENRPGTPLRDTLRPQGHSVDRNRAKIPEGHVWGTPGPLRDTSEGQTDNPNPNLT